MKRKYTIAATILVVVGLIAWGQETTQTSLTFKTPITKDAILNNDYVSIITDDMIIGSDVSCPDIPHRYVRFIIPQESDVSNVNIQELDKQKIKLNKRLIPAQLPIPTGKQSESWKFTEPNPAVYASDKAYPETIAEIVSVNYFDDNKIVTVKVSPFRYYPQSNTLEFYGKIDLSLSLKTARKQDNPNLHKKNLIMQANAHETRRSMLYDWVDNKDDVDLFAVKQTIAAYNVETCRRARVNHLGYEYLIVTNQTLAPAFDRFINWKKRKGLDIGIVTIEYIKSHYIGDLVSGIYDDAGKLRQFLNESYKQGTQFVLLGGDENVIPVRYARTNLKGYDTYENTIPTDIYFAEFTGDWQVDGDSLYGEYGEDRPVLDQQQVYIGRILCSTQEHVENWTHKILVYEKNPGNGDYSYLSKLFLTEADQMQDYDKYSTYIPSRLNMFKTQTLFSEKVNSVKKSYSPTLPDFPTGADVIKEYNKKYGLVCFMGHGCPTDVALATTYYNNAMNNNTTVSAPKYRIYTYDYIKPDPHKVNEYSNGGSLSNMNNYGYPNIHYSGSCNNIPYDNLSPYIEDRVDDSFGEVLTSVYKTGAVAFLGNTRLGWTTYSSDLFGYFANAIRNTTSDFTSIGVAEARSKKELVSSYQYHRYLILSHNLIGCPEMKIWTATPSVFTQASVTKSENDVTVNSGVAGCTICVMSASDNGASYFNVANDVSSYTFTNVPESYCVTITKKNYIPYLKDNDIHIQNQSYNNSQPFVTGNNFFIGNVTLAGNTLLQLEPEGEVTFNDSFEVQDKSVLKIK